MTHAEYQKMRRTEHLEHTRSIQRASYHRRKAQDPEFLLKKKDSTLRSKYGITLAQYNEMLAEQGGVCAICHRPESVHIAGKRIALSVDHNHETGAVRGLLCKGCNTFMGMVDNIPGVVDRILAFAKRGA